MNYFTNDYFTRLEVELKDYIIEYHKDYYKDFIGVIKDTQLEGVSLLELIDRDYIHDFMYHTKMYTNISNKADIDDVLNNGYIDYFMDTSYNEVLDYFKELSIIDVLIMTNIYKYNDIYYMVWDI